ncbi:MAG: ATP synthase F1 subunit delta [Clostridia bacterium]|nr:ATP synthase F1 subunit delta [Clostridia bacterium]
MNDVSREYGGALFELCYEEGIDEEIVGQLRAVSSYFGRDSDYVRFLTSPNIPMASRTAAVKDAFSGRVHAYVLNFIMMMTERSHASDISASFDEYIRLYGEKHLITEAEVKSAVALTDAQKAELEKKLSSKTGKKVTLKCTVDQSLIGGVSVYIDGELYDGTLSARLNDIRRRLTDTAIN